MSRHVKLIWGGSKVIKGHWYFGLFGFYDRVEGKHDDGLAISMRGLLLWLAAAGVAAYLAFATLLFWFWQRNPYSLLTYSDAVLRPIRRAEVRDRQGQAFIAQGIDAMRARHWAEAVSLLRQGLAYHPGDLRGRITLAQFYVAANQRPIALKLLQEGLGAEFPGRPFLQLLFEVAKQGEDFDLVLNTGNRFLAQLQGEATARDRRWLQSELFAAMIASQRYSEALALARAEEPGDTAEEHKVLALLGAGRPDEALIALDAWRVRPKADVRAVLRLRVRALREAKRFDEMDSELDQLRALSSGDPRPAVYGVVQRAMAGREAAATAALADFLFRFGGTAQNLQMLAEPLAEIGQRTMLERVVAAAADRGYPANPFQVLLVQTAVQKGDWPAASRTLAAMPAAAPRDTVSLIWREWMQRLLPAASTPSDTAGPALIDFLRSRPWPIKIHRLTVDALRLGGRLETARDVLIVAGSVFPASAWVETQRTDVARTLAAQQAAAAPVAVAGTALPGEKIYFQRLASLIRDEQWTEAEQLLRDARAAKPPPRWIDPRDGELRLAQIRILQGRGDVAGMVAAVKLYLNRDAGRSRQILDVASAVFAKGDKATAIALAKEILRSTPDFAAAKRALGEWQPKPVKK